MVPADVADHVRIRSAVREISSPLRIRTCSEMRFRVPDFSEFRGFELLTCAEWRSCWGPACTVLSGLFLLFPSYNILLEQSSGPLPSRCTDRS